MIEESASVVESVLFSVSAGVGLEAGNGEKVGLSTTGGEDKTDVIVNGSARWDRIVIKAGRVDVSVEESKEGEGNVMGGVKGNKIGRKHYLVTLVSLKAEWMNGSGDRDKGRLGHSNKGVSNDDNGTST
jgi:hypothetical protein